MKKDLKPTTCLCPVPAVMVGCGGTEEDYNIITIAWIGTVASNPPQVSISVRPERHSYQLIKKYKGYTVNLPTENMLAELDYCGLVSGAEVNKFEATGLNHKPAKEVEAPIIEESPLNLECRLTHTLELGSHELFVAEVVHLQASDELLDKNNRLDLSSLKSVAYQGREYWGLKDAIKKHGFSKGEGLF